MGPDVRKRAVCRAGRTGVTECRQSNPTAAPDTAVNVGCLTPVRVLPRPLARDHLDQPGDGQRADLRPVRDELRLHEAMRLRQLVDCHLLPPRRVLDDRPREHRDPEAGGHTADRKSTRLNSSHPSISYAVSCLKKKYTIQTS